LSLAAAPRSPDEIASDIAVTRNRLAGTIDTLVYRAQPKTIAQRQFATTKALFVTPEGEPIPENIKKAATVAAGVIAVMWVIRKLAG
jgi:Protein of unknown function (DUF3618)